MGRVAVVMALGPGVSKTMDTLASIEYYCTEPHTLVLVDDGTQDGTSAALLRARREHWHVLRNQAPFGYLRLVHSLCVGYGHMLSRTDCDLVFKIDQDALVIQQGLFTSALQFMAENPGVGMFGVYAHDFNRERSFECHGRQMRNELKWTRLLGMRPSWAKLLRIAETNGYRRGDNVFGGAYFLTRKCLAKMERLGALDVPFRWHSRLAEDVYFSMATTAGGFRLGHFAAPEGPLCLEWQGLPYPAAVLANSGYKVVHSVDKGANTGPDANGGKSAREVFAEFRAMGEAR